MRFSSFLQEGLYDKFFDIPSQIITIWKSKGKKTSKYRDIADFLQKKVKETTDMDIRVEMDISLNQSHGGSYNARSNTMRIIVGPDMNNQDLDDIISTFMHELTHVLQHRAGGNETILGKNYYNPRMHSDDPEATIKYFFQSAEQSAMLNGIIANLSFQGLTLSQLKEFIDSLYSGVDYQERKIEALKVATKLKMVTTSALYNQWSFLIRCLAYGVGEPTFMDRSNKFLDKLFREYGNFLYLKSKY